MISERGPHRTGSRRAGAAALGGLAHALDIAGDRWSLQVVAALADGPWRFADLAQRIGPIAPNILTARLRQLQRRGVVVAAPYSRRPLRLAYQLTDAGRELSGPIALLAAWGARHVGHTEPDGDLAPLHGRCGSALEATLYCPTCEQPATPGTDDDVVWL